MAAQTLAGFPTRFQWTLDDLRALVSGRPIIAEGRGLRPELVAPSSTHQPGWWSWSPPKSSRDLPRAASVHPNASDPARAQHNRLARDQLVTEDAVRCARRLGIPVIDVDGPASPTPSPTWSPTTSASTSRHPAALKAIMKAGEIQTVLIPDCAISLAHRWSSRRNRSVRRT